MIKYWQIEVEGEDKTGKDVLFNYICKMSDYKYSVRVRGTLSQLVYNEKFNRNYEFDLSNINKYAVIVYLYGETEDIKIRCDMTNEKPYSIDDDKLLYDKYINVLTYNGVTVLSYNTSFMTPYQIGADIIKKMDELENQTYENKINQV